LGEGGDFGQVLVISQKDATTTQTFPPQGGGRKDCANFAYYFRDMIIGAKEANELSPKHINFFQKNDF
jgi:hypothetical protein